MSMNLKYQSLDIKQIGRKATVPESNLAKLMYYLSCVFSVIQYEQSSRLTDYQRYYLLSKEEEQTVLGLVALFNPKIMTDLSLFIVAPDLVPSYMFNEFYQITDDRIGVHVNSEVVIGGRVVKVLMIMACKEEWIYRYYINPAQSFTIPQLTSSSNYNTSNNNSSSYKSSNYNTNNNNSSNYKSSNYNTTNNNNDNDSCWGWCKSCVCCFVFIIIIIAICTNV